MWLADQQDESHATSIVAEGTEVPAQAPTLRGALRRPLPEIHAYAEEATQHHDSSSLLLADDAPHKLGTVELSDEWAALPAAGGLQIRHFNDSDFPHVVLPLDHPTIAAATADVDRALGLLRALKRRDIPENIARDPTALIDDVLSGLPDPERFQAGGWTTHAEVWGHLFKPLARTRAAVPAMLEAVTTGLRWQLKAPAQQTAMPDHRKKMARLRQALARQGTPPAETSRILHSPRPAALRFPNHRSVEDYPAFVRDEIAALCGTGAVMQLPAGQRPLIVNPLGVADNKNPKLRLILDPFYPNLLFRYEQLRYEQLADVTHYLSPTDWATTTDEKSGYHHQVLHPSVWSLLGFEYEGRYYVFTHLPFGVGPACKAYTVVKQELYRIARAEGGARLTFLIDDLLSVADTPLHAAVQGAAMMLLQRALNFTLSVPKCKPYPTQSPDFLGMTVDIPELRFVLPQKKIDDFRALVAALEGAGETTNRQLARLAGKLVSFAPAIDLSPLYAQQLFKIMLGREGWDALYPTPALAVEAMRWVADHLEPWNGRTWASKRKVLTVAGDYSSTHGYASFTPNGEVEEPVVITHAAHDLALIAANRHSSTLGEIKAVYYTLQVLLAHHQHLVRGCTLHYESDSQAGVATLTSMAGNEHTFPWVRMTWELAKGHDVRLEFSWYPRKNQRQAAADAWSKKVDNSQWALNPQVFQQWVANHPLITSRGGLTIDVFADNSTCKVPRFYSRYWCPGTLGVNAFLHPWALNQVSGDRELCYINGDFSRMGEILRKVIDERVNCAIVYPDWPRCWQVMWGSMPVRTCYTLPRRNDLCVPGARVDPSKRRGRPPSYAIKVAIVLWD